MSTTAARLPTGVVVGFVVAASMVLPACTVGASTREGPRPGDANPVGDWDALDRDVLEAQVRSQLTKKNGQQAPPITCPDELDARIGAKTTCTMTGPEGTYSVTVTVTRVDWGNTVLDDGTLGNFVAGNAEFDAIVADKPY